MKNKENESKKGHDHRFGHVCVDHHSVETQCIASPPRCEKGINGCGRNDDHCQKLLSSDEAAVSIGYKPNTLAIWRIKKIGPAYHKLGCRVFYSIDDLQVWVMKRRIDPETRPA